MEVYLRQDTDILRFPVVPSEIGVNCSSDILTTNIIKLGEVSTFNGRKLKRIDIKSFLPNQEYSFCDYKGFRKPYDFVKKILDWQNLGHLLRITITDGVANFECKISSFSHYEKDGTRDVYFELSLIEYVRITIPKIPVNNNSSSNSNNSNSSRPPSSNNNQPKTHKVVRGDNLWDIAQKYYGDGKTYKKINEKNKAKYPSLAKNNIIYPNWVLVL